MIHMATHQAFDGFIFLAAISLGAWLLILVAELVAYLVTKGR